WAMWSKWWSWMWTRRKSASVPTCGTGRSAARDPAQKKPPPGDQGEVARPSRDGGDQSWQRPEANNPTVTLRVTAPFTQGSQPSQTPWLAAVGGGVSDAAVRTGGYKIRPYGPACGLLVGAYHVAGVTGSPGTAVPHLRRSARSPGRAGAATASGAFRPRGTDGP